MVADDDPTVADAERRFGGLRRLYGAAGYARLRAGRVAVVGLGGVGSWTVEALARCGVAALTLIDFDVVSESNIHRQSQALGSTVGMGKGEALRRRIGDIHPGCAVTVVDAFVEPGNWPGLLPGPVDVLVDACDRSAAKAALAIWSLATGVPLICVGAAGGKRRADGIELADLADTTHDPLLAGLRQRLRQAAAAPRQGAIGVRCVFSRESVAAPRSAHGSHGDGTSPTDGSLNCAGYGSSVTVTASFGMVAAGAAVHALLQAPADAAGKAAAAARC